MDWGLLFINLKGSDSLNGEFYNKKANRPCLITNKVRKVKTSRNHNWNYPTGMNKTLLFSCMVPHNWRMKSWNKKKIQYQTNNQQQKNKSKPLLSSTLERKEEESHRGGVRTVQTHQSEGCTLRTTLKTPLGVFRESCGFSSRWRLLI